MKSILLLLTLTLGLGTAHASNVVKSTVNAHGIELTIQLSPGHVFTKKLIDALIQSPKMEEVVNPYFPPGTFYKGEDFGLRVTLNEQGETGANLTFNLAVSEINYVTTSGTFAGVSSKSGAVKNFHQALLASKSQYVKTSPNSEGEGLGHASVYEKGFFSYETSTISCSPIRGTDSAHCSFGLK